jgi:hypothetical protein
VLYLSILTRKEELGSTVESIYRVVELLLYVCLDSFEATSIEGVVKRERSSLRLVRTSLAPVLGITGLGFTSSILLRGGEVLLSRRRNITE